jgi:hypothetical protein
MNLIAALQTFFVLQKPVRSPLWPQNAVSLGVRLVHRITHAVALTEEGRDLIPAAQKILDAAEGLHHLVGWRRAFAYPCFCDHADFF